MIKCPDCKDELYMAVNVMMEIPASMESALSKTNIKKKEVNITGADWPNSYYYCKNKKCKTYRRKTY